MQNKIKALLEKKGISARKLADDIGVTRQTVYNWMRSSTIPRYGSSIEKLDSHFGRFLFPVLTIVKQSFKIRSLSFKTIFAFSFTYCKIHFKKLNVSFTDRRERCKD